MENKDMLILEEANYYSQEANKTFMSVSQFKDFAGTYGHPGCQAFAMAKLRGEFMEAPSQAMMVGSYVDAYYEGTLDSFKEANPAMFKRDGNLKAEFVKAEKMIERAERDSFFKKYMSGEKQVIMTGELFGTTWKIKMDSYFPGKAIVDLKCMSSLTKMYYVPNEGYMDFIRYWGYDLQGAIYQEIVYRNTGERLPFFIAGISKEEAIDIEVIGVNNLYLEDCLDRVEKLMPEVLAVKNGEMDPKRCGQCHYCRDTKVLTRPIAISEIGQSDS